MEFKMGMVIALIGLVVAVVMTLLSFDEIGASFDGALQQQVIYLKGIFWLLLGILWAAVLNISKKISD